VAPAPPVAPAPAIGLPAYPVPLTPAVPPVPPVVGGASLPLVHATSQIAASKTIGKTKITDDNSFLFIKHSSLESVFPWPRGDILLIEKCNFCRTWVGEFTGLS
jgi:hypothetical protein